MYIFLKIGFFMLHIMVVKKPLHKQKFLIVFKMKKRIYIHRFNSMLCLLNTTALVNVEAGFISILCLEMFSMGNY